MEPNAMTQQPLRLYNPITGEIKLVNRSGAKTLRRYGWVEVTLEQWFAYQQSLVVYGLAKAQGRVVRH